MTSRGRAFVDQQGIGAVGRVPSRPRPRPVEALPCGSRSISRTDWPAGGEGGGEVDGGRGFADAAFLVGDGEDAPVAHGRLGGGGDRGRDGAQRLTGGMGRADLADPENGGGRVGAAGRPAGCACAIVRRRRSIRLPRRGPSETGKCRPGRAVATPSASKVASGARARAVISAGGRRSQRLRSGWRGRSPGAPVSAAASRRKAALRWSASTRSKGRPVAIASTSPGNPAPEPRSMARSVSGGIRGSELQAVGDVAGPDLVDVPRRDQVDGRVPAQQQVHIGARAAPVFHVKHRRGLWRRVSRETRGSWSGGDAPSAPPARPGSCPGAARRRRGWPAARPAASRAFPRTGRRSGRSRHRPSSGTASSRRNAADVGLLPRQIARIQRLDLKMGARRAAAGRRARETPCRSASGAICGLPSRSSAQRGCPSARTGDAETLQRRGSDRLRPGAGQRRVDLAAR